LILSDITDSVIILIALDYKKMILHQNLSVIYFIRNRLYLLEILLEICKNEFEFG